MDDVVDIGNGDGETDQDMAAVAGLGEFEARAAHHHFLAEAGEGADQLLQIHDHGAAGVQRHHVHAKTRLQFGEAIELVQHHFRGRIALDLDDHAHAVTVAFVADVADAFDALVAHEFGDLLLHARLVHLKGQLGDDDGFAVLADFLDAATRPHEDRAAPTRQRAARRLLADEKRAGRKIRPRHDFGQGIHADGRIVDISEAGVDHFAQIVRRDIRRHADGDAARAVDEQIRKAGGKNDRLAFGAVVIVLEMHRVLVDIFGQHVRDLGAARFGVAHRRRRIAIDGAEIALPVDERRAHGEILRHANQGVIDRLVAVRVILTHHIADDQRAFAIGLVPVTSVLVHRKQDAPMHRLEAVARVGKGTRNDHAHRIIEIGTLQFVLDRDRQMRGAA